MMLKKSVGLMICLLVLGTNIEAGTEASPMPPEASNPSVGAKVYQSLCMTCHQVDKPTEQGPPIFAVKDHVIKAFPERAAFVERVKTWVKDPKADTALMPGALTKFGLMPAQTQASEEELQAVAEFLYDTDLAQPDWYAEHYQAEHGKQPDQKP